ncbi:MAG: sporulation transcription factor Spo0A [Clostridiales bacterium]|nr:sporulation transcription factor Spo0A [Clostridiales bacterium]
MSSIRVLIVDDHEELRASLYEFLRHQQGIEVVGEAGNGIDALKQVESTAVDVMLLDMIMPNLDGFGVLAELQRFSPEKRPKVIAITALSRDDFICRAVNLGVSYYMIKPLEQSVVLERIRDVAQMGSGNAADSKSISTPGTTIDDKLSNLFLTMGIPAHIKGYQFLREAIKLVMENPTMISGITKELYPAIARRFSTTSSKVERAIRHAIEVAWSRGRIDALNKAFGCCVALPDEKPTNGEFIALIADKLSMERSA